MSTITGVRHDTGGIPAGTAWRSASLAWSSLGATGSFDEEQSELSGVQV